MSGDYNFPKRVFTKAEPFDALEVNEALQPAAEQVNGHLTQHNFRAPLSSTILSDTGTFSRTDERYVEVSNGLANHVSGPTFFATGGFQLSQETSWQLVTGPTPANDLRIEMNTGTSDLVVTAQVSHCYQGAAVGDTELQRLTIAVVQGVGSGKLGRNEQVTIGIRLNGTLYTVPIDTSHSTYRDQRTRQVAYQISVGGISCFVGSIAYNPVDWEAAGWATSTAGNNVVRFKSTIPGVFPGLFEMTALSSVTGITGVFDRLREGTAFASSAAFDTLNSVYPNTTTKLAVVYYPAQIQYALRVDGAVITETITGRFDNEQGALRPFRVVDPRAIASTDTPLGPLGAASTGVYVSRGDNRPDAVNRPMHTVRLTATVPVSPGLRVVEVVARRVPCGLRRSFRTGVNSVGNFTPAVGAFNPQPPDSHVVLYNRQLSVTESPIDPVGSARFVGAVTVPAFAEEDEVSHQSLLTDRVDVIVDALNEIKDYQVARGAINGDHLESYSAVLATGDAAKTAAISFDSLTAPYERAGALGRVTIGLLPHLYQLQDRKSWQLLLSDPLTNRLSASAAAPLECVISVEANVHLSRLRPSATGQADEMHLSAAAFCIALEFEVSGVYEWKLWHPSTGWANSNDYYAQQPSKTSLTPLVLKSLSHYEGVDAGDFVDIPVTAQFVLTGESALKRDIRGVALFGSAAHMRAGTEAEVRVDRCSLNAIVTKS